MYGRAVPFVEMQAGKLGRILSQYLVLICFDFALSILSEDAAPDLFLRTLYGIPRCVRRDKMTCGHTKALAVRSSAILGQ